ncbi:MAG TPA: hypothetical protein VLG09_03070 [Candidatus Saccharimonadales bacterium]|nr:hypothetical protein [Candidatus Saccharimonadales bacterium]
MSTATKYWSNDRTAKRSATAQRITAGITSAMRNWTPVRLPIAATPMISVA